MIRIATLADLDAVTALHAGDSRADWAEAVERGGALCAWLGDEIVGAAAYEEHGDAVVLTRFRVSPAHRRKGMGRQLHTGCVDVWRADQFTHATVEVPAGDACALAFCAVQDWVPAPGAPRSGDRLVLRLTLTSEPE
ncbi:GNAT family N-acetyltransferase [Streptomyces sp. NPDC020807]|uniref:GNAT family N-acetyltransferase n=1 Tax=Streptomyces sp. NPDC020807 TaxID=3155119 RepID=UPI0033DF5B3D